MQFREKERKAPGLSFDILQDYILYLIVCKVSRFQKPDGCQIELRQRLLGSQELNPTSNDLPWIAAAKHRTHLLPSLPQGEKLSIG